MSERVLALLVRLYPAAFRQKYREEALQLYRDRLRDERGLVRKLRLYCDLLEDAVTGLPLAWRNSYKDARTAPTIADLSGIPSFGVLKQEPLRPGSVAMGSLFSVVALVAFGLVMRLPLPHRFPNSGGALSPVEAVLERLNRVVSPATSSGSGGDGSASTVNGGSSQTRATVRPESRRAAATEKPLTVQERDQVIRAVGENLTARYFDRQKAEAAFQKLRALRKQGAYDRVVDGSTLAQRLTEDIRSATGDFHLIVVYSRNAIPSAARTQPSMAEIKQYRAMLIKENCSVEKAEILPGNIGYLKFNSFPDLTVCGATLQKAMESVGRADAVIFDLRDNTGGFPETVADVAAPLFDHTVPWYNPRATQSVTTLSPEAASRLANKPVYILSSSRTLSGAEQFTYNLKMLKRATVIGETTGGGGHVGTFHRLDEHFGMGMAETKITNPYGAPDWDGVGVEPDVKVKSADALEAAEKMAGRRVRP
ncbi:MAG TPA: S41 family peptidase [Terracidiphilus sp.]|jgi:hypothetical protein|nr:S41 family peptidase [Terracidiphilus sp.]